MLAKIFLVAIFIVLSWSTIKVSENNVFLKEQLTEIKNQNEDLTKDLLSNNELLIKQGNTIAKNSNLSELNKSLLLKITKIESKLAGLTHSKKSFEQINKALKKQSNAMLKHTNSIADLKLCKAHNTITKKTASKKKTAAKPQVTPTSLDRVFIKFYETKEMYHNKNTKKAIERLSKLKSELWKIRNLETVSKEKVMSVLSSIDITKKKWENKETNYDLSNIATKINLLAPDTVGACK